MSSGFKVKIKVVYSGIWNELDISTISRNIYYKNSDWKVLIKM